MLDAMTSTGGRSLALASPICIRAAGVSFDVLDRLGTPALAASARRVNALAVELDACAERSLAQLALEVADNRTLRSRLEGKLKRRAELSAERVAAHPWLAPYAHATAALRAAAAALDAEVDRAFRELHPALVAEAARELPDFLVFESQTLASLELDAAPGDGSKPRQLARTLALYLQRVAAKGDTISRFGPSGWGRIGDGEGLRLDPVPGIAARRVEVERWVVTALIEVMNADPELRAEVCPRTHPDLYIDPGDPDAALVARCDGASPAHQLGDPAALARLAERGSIIWELERYAVDVSPLASLIGDVESWRAAPLRTRWLARLSKLRDLASAFGAADVSARRLDVLASFRAELADLGVAQRERGRALYAAANPINENCFREYHCELGRRTADRVVADVAPWLDLFRDAYRLSVARAFARYRELVVAAPRPRGRLSYADLLVHARTHGLAIEDDKSLVAIGRDTFAEIRRAFGAALEPRADAAEIALTAADCHVVRAQHDLPPGGELADPSIDLQLAAGSLADVAAGRCTWVVAELHQPLLPMQHVLYWSCPDKPALHAAMAEAVAHQPFAVRGSLAEQPVHVAGEAVFAALPRATLVHRGRPKPGWSAVRPADAEVVLDDEHRDIRLRDPSGSDLGSLVRGFRHMMGMHPFFPFERAPHASRLRLGDVIVQRRAWHVTSTELGEPRPVGVAGAFVRAVERLRGDRGVPRWVFVRPSAASHAQRLRTDDMYARDKDLKPFYVDLESVVFLDILERRLRKYGELVLAEMLPAPDQLVWASTEGRRVFELRASLVPA
jgi:hypothetical protein